jgi:ferredoxin
MMPRQPLEVTTSPRFAMMNADGGGVMRVVVDFDRCESNALCMVACPEVFEVRDDDFLYVLEEQPPEELRDKVEQAVRACPTQAITIEE